MVPPANPAICAWNPCERGTGTRRICGDVNGTVDKVHAKLRLGFQYSNAPSQAAPVKVHWTAYAHLSKAVSKRRRQSRACNTLSSATPYFVHDFDTAAKLCFYDSSAVNRRTIPKSTFPVQRDRSGVHPAPADAADKGVAVRASNAGRHRAPARPSSGCPSSTAVMPLSPA